MARTDKERYDQALTYVGTWIGAELRQSITDALRHRTAEEVGAELSLKGQGYWWNGTEGQHTAVRALLLCHKAFLKAPWAVGLGGAPFDYNSSPTAAQTFFKSKSEDDVKRALRCYLPVPGADRADLVRAATEIQNPGGGMTWETMTRTTTPFPSMPVCFDALKMWLFKAGFVSLRWLAKTGPGMTAQTVNTMLGQGEVVSEQAMLRVPAGYLFNFHKKGDQAVCHWGVYLGDGWAAGSNTSADWPGASAPVNFRSGGSGYGIFTLASALEVCKHKYGEIRKPAEVVVRKIDPTAVGTYF